MTVVVNLDFCFVSDKEDHKLAVIVSVICSLFAACVCLLLSWWMCKQRGKHVTSLYEEWKKGLSDSSEIVLRGDLDKASIEELPSYSFEMIENATNNFNVANKLGMGGFGPVYKVNCLLISAQICFA